MMAKVIGILGGMGPEATCDLFQKIIRVTPLVKGPIRRDQDHLRVIVDSNPAIPDRTAAILGGGEDPVPLLQETARNLERAGAGLLVMPCNTAHYFWLRIQEAVTIPLLHMMDEVGKELAAAHRGVRRIGLLATSGTVNTGLYHRTLAGHGLEVMVPGADTQARVMAAIAAVKKGELEPARAPLVEAAAELAGAGAEAIVAGCTEIPLVLQQPAVGVPLLDATWVLAKAAVTAACR